MSIRVGVESKNEHVPKQELRLVGLKPTGSWHWRCIRAA